MRPGLRGRPALLASACLAGILLGCGRVPVVSALPLSATSVSFADLDGIRAEIARHRDRPVVLNFWATWCGPCLDELPDLAAVARDSAGPGPDFVGVSLDGWVIASESEAEVKVREALAAAGVAYPNLIYRGDQDPLVDGFKLPGPIPYTILYDRAGREVKTWIGGVGDGDLREAIAALP